MRMRMRIRLIMRMIMRMRDNEQEINKVSREVFNAD
jgi:hypothetical protein